MTIQKKILVIDDEEAVRRSFELALESLPFTLETVDCGEKGVEAVKKIQYDLIFLDLKMPGINGVETMKQIRVLYPTVPIYVVTAFHKEFLSDLDEVRTMRLPFQLLRKPIGRSEIQTLVKSVLDQPISYS
ncbi:MAG: response regulator [Gammaproteobacteria bacterium]|nr:response regulator [Gammaproteobacteria bacterium]